MRIDELLARGTTTSFEFFPPKTEEEARALDETLLELEDLSPSFVSVTYRGGASSRQPTYDLVRRLHGRSGTQAMAHLTSVHHSRDELAEILSQYAAAGIENLMLLGGDPDPEHGAAGELRHAVDLVHLAREVGSFCVGVAAQPAGHPDSPDLASDRRFLAEKLAEADFAVTQLFFEATEWVALVEDLASLGVAKSVVPGIMPVTATSSVRRMRDLGGVVPDWLVERLEAAAPRGPGAVRAEGIDAATELCAELLAAGAPGLHFFTLNRSTATREIYRRLRA